MIDRSCCCCGKEGGEEKVAVSAFIYYDFPAQVNLDMLIKNHRSGIVCRSRANESGYSLCVFYLSSHDGQSRINRMLAAMTVGDKGDKGTTYVCEVACSFNADFHYGI